MTTTDWTAIGRGFAIRRSANRPPWGGRKTRHGSIVAPVAATLAATVAVGVGIALAKAERDRRSARHRRGRDRQFGLLPDERLADGLRRLALGQLDLAIELLECDWGGVSVEKTVHETRKSLKRLRALIRLLEEELGERTFARENAVLRDAGLRLAGARDAEVMVKTLDGLLRRHPRKLGRRQSLIKLRKELAAERDSAAERLLHDTTTRAEVLGDLRAVRGRVAEWSLPDRGGIATVEAGLKRLYREGRRRRWRAARGKGDRAQAMHQWRKRVKDLRYAAEMLDRRAPDGGEAWRAKRGKRQREQARRGRTRGASAAWPAGPTSWENCSGRSTTWRCSPSAHARTESRDTASGRGQTARGGHTARPCPQGPVPTGPGTPAQAALKRERPC